jgi:hypothetical protein
MRQTKNGQAAKLLTCDINEFGHRAAPTVRGSSDGQTRQGLAVALYRNLSKGEILWPRAP